MRPWIGVFVIATASCGAKSELNIGEPASHANENEPGVDPGATSCDVVFSDATPGKNTCPGCPTLGSASTGFEQVTSDSVFSIDSTVLGRVRDNDGPGKWQVVSAEGNVGGDIATGSDGFYATKAPLFCGAQTLDIGWCNDAGTSSYRLLIERQACVAGGLHVTLTWGEGANDLELHLLREGAYINDPLNDCTWTTCVDTSPDWGQPGQSVDDPHKDIDWLDDNGVENIELPLLELMRYPILVEYWGTGEPIEAVLTVNAFGTASTWSSPLLSPQDVWIAGTVDATTRTVKTRAGVVDCSDAWRSGCQLPIP
ncbi:MAG TPA: hypothetical protein VFB62_18550 [Polyangiaceae bacterium]|nr:hypothetical protein [Polyangiaceae bacterium]